ncbi:hypothetical protein JOC94_002355 [Bacillus thermophilus]|uniref:DUF4258 domain-containing protein n=1 Tax=Siminovitchia thermophila TaxID=1245522 RepID=A0ABS2R6T5_9BACI|nr:DUF4258 domain-containing protein [Siminovitchia thermophila]MBM7715368.1 hypothetical protein [Siminovitchia thermophila]
MTIECNNQHECKRKRERWEELQQRFCPLGQKELDRFLEKIKKGKAKVVFDKHFQKRSLERSVSEIDVKEIISYGWVIERNKTTKSKSIVLLGYVGRNFRPLHVVFDMVSDDLWVVVTAYNPKSHAWKWNDRFNKRICFCNPEDVE